jgi:GT2 family glycosyltransferase
MKFSLILSTVERTQELGKFLESLKNQSYRNFQLIIIDQNKDDRLSDIILPYKKQYEIVYLKSEKGLSKGRNAGLKYTFGDIVSFPDDDCEYPKDLLQEIKNFFENFPEWDGLTGCSIDYNGFYSAGNFSNNKGPINILNLWNRNISFSIFLKSHVLKKVGMFDESLGLGASSIFLSGEETDYLIRALKIGSKIFYSPEFKVYHPNPIKTYSEKALTRAYYYGCGWGRVLKKHRYPLWFKIKSLIRPLGASIISLSLLRKRKCNYHLNVFRGRLKGMTSP